MCSCPKSAMRSLYPARTRSIAATRPPDIVSRPRRRRPRPRVDHARRSPSPAPTCEHPRVRFTGTLQAARGGGHTVALPVAGKEAFGQARAPVRGTVNGTALRTRLMVYGGVASLGLRKAVGAAAGRAAGDSEDVRLELDDEPREVELPPELAARLDADARAAFDAPSFPHRREYARWVADAKRP